METMTQIVNTISKALSVKFMEYNKDQYYFTKFVDGYDLDVRLTLDNWNKAIRIEAKLFGDAIKFKSETFADINSVSVLKEVSAIVENAKSLVKSIETFTNKKGVYSY